MTAARQKVVFVVKLYFVYIWFVFFNKVRWHFNKIYRFSLQCVIHHITGHEQCYPTGSALERSLLFSNGALVSQCI